jgi:aminomethyltransferase
MVDYAGFDLPVQYVGILEEHRAVRTGAGLFDVSHMGEVFVSGPGALPFLQHLLVNDVSRADGLKAVYSPMCREDGGTVDDLIVYRMESETYLLVVNAANTAKDLAWIRESAEAFASTHSAGRVLIEDASSRYAQIALQGPLARRLLTSVPGFADAAAIGRFKHVDVAVPAGVLGPRSGPVLVSRTGYTGEDGYELYLAPEDAPALWRMLVSLGAVPAGLGARDSLRFEAALPLYGHELSDTISPVEAGLTRFVSFTKPSFAGRTALLRQYTQGPSRRLVGLASLGKVVPRADYPVLSGTRPVGHVTSGLFSPTLNRGLAMALVESLLGNAPVAPIPECAIRIRERDEPFEMVPLPFHRKPKSL